MTLNIIMVLKEGLKRIKTSILPEGCFCSLPFNLLAVLKTRASFILFFPLALPYHVITLTNLNTCMQVGECAGYRNGSNHTICTRTRVRVLFE